MSVLTFTILGALILWCILLTISAGKLLDAVRAHDDLLASHNRSLATINRTMRMRVQGIPLHMVREPDNGPEEPAP
jgi:hypothetical protein